MSKINDYIKYTCSGYKHATESFRSYKVFIDQSGRGNHSYIPLKLSKDQEWEIGYACMTKGKEAARALAKKYDRQRSKKPRQFITYGFLDANDKHRYHFTQQLRCLPDSPLTERHRIFKEFKDYLLRHDGKIKRYDQCKLDGHYRPEEVTEVYDTADISKPVIVRLNVKGD